MRIEQVYQLGVYIQPAASVTHACGRRQDEARPMQASDRYVSLLMMIGIARNSETYKT